MQNKDLTKRSSFFYHLPEELIAQHPVPGRASSRLLVAHRHSLELEHKQFADILNYLKPGDVLVRNNTRVIPARLLGAKSTGAKVEVFLLNQIDPTHWECLVKPGRRLLPGAEIVFSNDFSAHIKSVGEEGTRIVEFSWQGDFWKTIDAMGHMPLPPYIQREATERDKETYQTVYAHTRGSVAAPTAGLHFTDEILHQLQTNGIQTLDVLLHVGLGTFRPVKTDDITAHAMHSEFCSISPQTAAAINQAKDEGRRIIAVGTTSTRTLESFAADGRVRSGSHFTNIFIYPGKELQIIDGLLTNFHMPESTLLMLVSAFAGYDTIMHAYRQAVEMRYRFFSYGDAMLLI
jgi:S-adenosylmethionine:tRNA ribosyltransferase-isomerase